MKGEGDTEWLPAAANTPLVEGDSVWCPGGSRAEVELADGSVVRLDGRTNIDIIDLGEDFSRFHVGMGHVYVHTGARGRSLQFDVFETSVRVDDRSTLRIDITDDGMEEVSIFRGSAYVEGDSGRTRVRTGEMLTMEEGRSEVSPLAPPDKWERWNRDRDRAEFERRVESAYLPEELGPYSDDLERNGSWVDVPEYGSCWRPTVILGADWAPYRVGRWVWRGDDYVWISYESWGWAPYHYGRWISVPRYGWCWVPPRRGDVYWSPGYVGWVVTNDTVGWVPLAPGEIYYGRGYYGRSSVNITQVNITTINTTQVVYRNAAVRNGAMFVRRDGFAAGRISYVRPQQGVDVLMRQRTAPVPEFRPQSREARMPVVKQVPRAKLPPPTVGRLPARELRERFPRLQEQRPVAPSPAGRPTREGERKQLPGRPAPGGEATPPRGGAPAVTVSPREERRGEPIHERERGPRPAEQRPAAQPQAAPQTRPQVRAPAPAGGQPGAPARPQPGPQPGQPRRVWNVRPAEQRPAAQPAGGQRKAEPKPAQPQRRIDQRPAEQQERRERRE
jgi:hypothetical protein